MWRNAIRCMDPGALRPLIQEFTDHLTALGYTRLTMGELLGLCAPLWRLAAPVRHRPGRCPRRYRRAFRASSMRLPGQPAEPPGLRQVREPRSTLRLLSGRARRHTGGCALERKSHRWAGCRVPGLVEASPRDLRADDRSARPYGHEAACQRSARIRRRTTPASSGGSSSWRPKGVRTPTPRR